jgi:probable F420-dependent oxidoreductase
MRFGIIFANVGPFAAAAGAKAIATAAEETGFDSLWTVEHVLVPADYTSEYPYDPSGRMPGGDSVDLPDPLVWLAYVAAVTTTIRLGTGILIVPMRNPAITAKEVASLDHLSGGRVLLGVGAGWLEEEFDALGVPFAARGRRLDAYLAAMRALWGEDQASVDNEFVSFANAISLPKPTDGSVPIVVGGHTDAAARRAGRLGDGFFPGRGTPERLAELIAVMRHTAEDAGRDPDAIEVTAGTTAVLGDDPLGAVAELVEVGVDRVAVPPLSFDPSALPDALASFRERVMDRV